jgi:hypothetical protein
MYMSLTACNIGTTPKLPFGVNTTIELKKIQLHPTTPVPLLKLTPPDAGIIGCSCNDELNRDINPKRQFLGCATTAFSERYLPLGARGGAVG